VDANRVGLNLSRSEAFFDSAHAGDRRALECVTEEAGPVLDIRRKNQSVRPRWVTRRSVRSGSP